MPLLEVCDLRVHFATATGTARAVDGVTFALEAGRTLGLVGESGCGKSTLARVLLRLLPAEARVAGTVRFEGRSVLDLSGRELRAVRGGGIALVFQEPAAALNPVYRLGSQVAETVRAHRRLSRRGAWAAALDLLRAVQMPEPERVARQYPHQVSGGMAQRVALALALAGRPRLLVADEPTSALDVTVRAEILRLLRDVCTRLGTALLVISHDFDVVAALADRVAVMYAGRLVEQGPAADVFRRPLHPYTAALLACRPRLGQVGRLPSIEGMVPPATHFPPGCRFRDRCPGASAACLAEPPRTERDPAHHAVCWHPLEAPPPHADQS